MCGKDLTVADQETGQRQDSRVKILMSHEHTRLTVSEQEASRIETETTKRLIKSTKLSLILDLDQTVIHASVQPEIEQWLQNPDMRDHPSVQDIHRFHLPDSPGVYYVKLRPGLHNFLDLVSKYYELHIYTMGTRNYAAEISRIIDPNGSIFKERVLSRDESGSMTQKNIKRLFPCDDSMVVVVDDRADVWQWSPSLIKVRPYRFFTDTGDINAPPNSNPHSMPPSQLPLKQVETPIIVQTAEHEATDEWLKDMQSQLPPPAQEPTFSAHEVEESAKESQLAAESFNLEELVSESEKPVAQRTPPFPLNDADLELFTLTNVLEDLNRKFYHAHEQHPPPNGAVKVQEVDVKLILPAMKRNILMGTHILFSGVFPQGSRPESSEVWMLSTSFGAVCHKTVDDEITHVVASGWGTDKVLQVAWLVDEGRDIAVVYPEWLYDSVSRWSRQNEQEYSIMPEKSQLRALLDKSRRPPSAMSMKADTGVSLYQQSNLQTMDSGMLEDLEREMEEELGEYFGEEESLMGSDGIDDSDAASERSFDRNARHKPRRKSPLQHTLNLESDHSDPGGQDEDQPMDKLNNNKRKKRRRVKESPVKRHQRMASASKETSSASTSDSGDFDDLLNELDCADW